MAISQLIRKRLQAQKAAGQDGDAGVAELVAANGQGQVGALPGGLDHDDDDDSDVEGA